MRRLLAIVLIVSACATSPSGTPEASPSAAPSAQASTAPSDAPSATLETSPEPSLATLPTAWSLVTATGDLPAAREDHTWTVDPQTGTAYLFGGRDGSTVFGDVFGFDLASHTWSRLNPPGSGPPARFGHEAAWVPGLGLAVFAGQASATQFFGDLWVFDPAANQWTQLPAAGDAPVPRYGSCSGLGPDGRLWISHGFTEDGTRFFDTKAYDFGLQSWTDVTPDGRAPVERCLHACWWTEADTFALYGGQTTGVAALGDLWSLTPDAAGAPAAWVQAQGTLPAERALPAFADLGAFELVFGGRSIDRGYLGDAFIIDDITLAVSPLETTGTGPSARASATLISDPSRARAMLFGGIGADGALGDLWQLGSP